MEKTDVEINIAITHYNLKFSSAALYYGMYEGYYAIYEGYYFTFPGKQNKLKKN